MITVSCGATLTYLCDIAVVPESKKKFSFVLLCVHSLEI